MTMYLFAQNNVSFPRTKSTSKDMAMYLFAQNKENQLIKTWLCTHLPRTKSAS